MKNTFITLLIIILSLSGCRTIKDRSSASNRVQEHSSQSSTFEWMYSDSTGRHWHYHSDSILFYHPDVGLYGQGGWLTVSERQVSHGDLRLHQNSSNQQSEEATQERVVSTSKRIPWWGWTLAVTTFSLLLGIGMARRIAR